MHSISGVPVDARALVVLSVLISIAGTRAYLADILRGTTQPNKVSWLMWAAGPLIGASAAMAAHADGWTTARVFSAGVLSLAIFLISFVSPRGGWRLTWADILCGFLSGVAMVLWLRCDSPRTAIVMAVVADIFATLPTLQKAWKKPKSETAATYVAGLASAVVVLPTIPSLTVEHLAFQLYFVGLNMVILAVIFLRKGLTPTVQIEDLPLL
jgi:hypothetical protein